MSFWYPEWTLLHDKWTLQWASALPVQVWTASSTNLFLGRSLEVSFFAGPCSVISPMDLKLGQTANIKFSFMLTWPSHRGAKPLRTACSSSQNQGKKNPLQCSLEVPTVSKATGQEQKREELFFDIHGIELSFWNVRVPQRKHRASATPTQSSLTNCSVHRFNPKIKLRLNVKDWLWSMAWSKNSHNAASGPDMHKEMTLKGAADTSFPI